MASDLVERHRTQGTPTVHRIDDETSQAVGHEANPSETAVPRIRVGTQEDGGLWCITADVRRYEEQTSPLHLAANTAIDSRDIHCCHRKHPHVFRDCPSSSNHRPIPVMDSSSDHAQQQSALANHPVTFGHLPSLVTPG